jgi:hypothetical protein
VLSEHTSNLIEKELWQKQILSFIEALLYGKCHFNQGKFRAMTAPEETLSNLGQVC